MFISICTTLLLAACGGSSNSITGSEEPIVQDIEITLSQKEIQVPASGGKYTVEVTTTGGRWEASKSAGWVTLSVQDSYSSAGKMVITVNPNEADARSATISVKSGDLTEKVQIEQEAAFKISRSEIMMKSGGDEYSLTLSGRKDWTATVDTDWVKLEKMSDTSLKITALPSSENHTRIATISIVAGEEVRTMTVGQESVEQTTIQEVEGYELVWHDEFNEGTELDPVHWTHEVQKSGWVNQEEQNYVNGEYNGRRVTELSDGKLRIHCFKSGNIYSGRVYAHVNEGWQYGYIEARILLPKGKGTWPAFWMMPVEVDWANEGWPKCGEIDIMEEVGVVPNEVSSSLHAEGHNHTNGTQVTAAKTTKDAEGEFHTYAIKWTAQNITTYVDGEVLLSYDNDNGGVKNWPYSKPYYIILNLAWGGSWGGMNGVDYSALPVSYVIDYVRVYQEKEK
ncbi:MAG: family 16 glycosylhydrolase [Bacteroides sp.]|nr:family 16 glycosylhydrolase [Bacteroides sp.]